MWRTVLLIAVMSCVWGGVVQAVECPTLLQGEVQKLRSEERINLCTQFAGKPLVV
ncbi:glutathione peroxidase, partial [Pseudomonas sp. HMWF010]